MLSNALCIYLEKMWEAFHAGLGLQPMCNGIIMVSFLIQVRLEFSAIYENLSMSVVVTT
jgi:hypothetical protein